MDNAGSPPLSGLTVGRGEPGRPFAIAEWLLGGLGAVTAGAGAPGRPVEGWREPDLVVGGEVTPLTRADPDPDWHGVPSATVAYATGAALATAALAARRWGRPVGVSELDVAVQVFLPEVMALAYSSPTAMRPSGPRRAPGGGWVHADLGAGDDRELFELLLATLPPDADASTVAASAQEWRLAVCDYRRRASGPARFPIAVRPPAGDAEAAVRPAGAGGGPTPGGLPLDDVVVTDLTAMWAGPLATWLLHGLGAAVHKVEPDFRPDGFRGLDGRGIHPFGRQVAPGRDSAMWNALNHGKRRENLDLRRPDHRSRFLELASASAVVIDAFSPRVMANLGLSALPVGPSWLSMPAFADGPRRSWIAYGSGVHALAGLGDLGDGTFAEPLVSYPDPVAGFIAALAAVAAIVGRDRGVAVRRMEVPLEAATQPLVAWSAPPERTDPARSPGSALLRSGSFETRSVAGMGLSHPRPPFVLF